MTDTEFDRLLTEWSHHVRTEPEPDMADVAAQATARLQAAHATERGAALRVVVSLAAIIGAIVLSWPHPALAAVVSALGWLALFIWQRP